jgi:hypothetical protein
MTSVETCDTNVLVQVALLSKLACLARGGVGRLDPFKRPSTQIATISADDQ